MPINITGQLQAAVLGTAGRKALTGIQKGQEQISQQVAQTGEDLKTVFATYGDDADFQSEISSYEELAQSGDYTPKEIDEMIDEFDEFSQFDKEALKSTLHLKGQIQSLTAAAKIKSNKLRRQEVRRILGGDK